MADLPKISRKDMQSLINFFNEIQKAKQSFGDVFYGNVTRAHPDLEKMFNNTHRTNLGYVFLQAVIAVLNTIDKGGNWRDMLHKVGYTHKLYAIKDEHYDLVAGALKASLLHYKNYFPSSPGLTMGTLDLVFAELMREFKNGYLAQEQVLVLTEEAQDEQPK